MAVRSSPSLGASAASSLAIRNFRSASLAGSVKVVLSPLVRYLARFSASSARFCRAISGFVRGRDGLGIVRRAGRCIHRGLVSSRRDVRRGHERFGLLVEIFGAGRPNHVGDEAADHDQGQDEEPSFDRGAVEPGRTDRLGVRLASGCSWSSASLALSSFACVRARRCGG